MHVPAARGTSIPLRLLRQAFGKLQGHDFSLLCLSLERLSDMVAADMGLGHFAQGHGNRIETERLAIRSGHISHL